MELTVFRVRAQRDSTTFERMAVVVVQPERNDFQNSDIVRCEHEKPLIDAAHPPWEGGSSACGVGREYMHLN